MFSRDSPKGAHLSHRTLPIVSAVSSAIGGLLPSPSDASSPTPPIDLPSDSPSDSIPSIPPLSLLSTSSSVNGNASDLFTTSADTNSTSSNLSSLSLPSSPPSPTSNSTSNATSQSSTNLSSIDSGSSSNQPLPSSRVPTTLPSSTHTGSPPSFANTGSSTLTEVYTSISGSITVAITITILPSLSNNPDSAIPFFKNKGQAAAVLTVLILLGILGFGFLGYRFTKTIKSRQLERDLQEASRLNRSRVILDDWDDDTHSANDSMQQIDSSIQSALQPISPISLNRPSGTSTSMKSSMSTFRDLTSFELTRPLRSFKSPVSPEEDGILSASTKQSNGNTNSDAYGSRSSNSTSNPFLDREYFQPPTPPVLPETFGEDTQAPSTGQSAVLDDEDDLDYIRLIQHSLRIANE